METNNGIVVTGGAFNADKVIIGKNAKIEQHLLSKEDKEEPSKDIPANNCIAFKETLKGLIAKGELKEPIEQLYAHFKANCNEKGQNAVVIHSQSLARLEDQENLGTIAHEQAKIDRSKIANYILQIIDNEFNNDF